MLRTLVISLAAALALGSAAYADNHHGGRGDDMPGPSWISMDQALQKLHALGYRTVIKLEAEDGYWKAKALKDTEVFKIHLDPRSGAVASTRRDDDD